MPSGSSRSMLARWRRWLTASKRRIVVPLLRGVFQIHLIFVGSCRRVGLGDSYGSKACSELVMAKESPFKEREITWLSLGPIQAASIALLTSNLKGEAETFWATRACLKWFSCVTHKKNYPGKMLEVPGSWVCSSKKTMKALLWSE